jgi:hypothetical protein
VERSLESGQEHARLILVLFSYEIFLISSIEEGRSLDQSKTEYIKVNEAAKIEVRDRSYYSMPYSFQMLRAAATIVNGMRNSRIVVVVSFDHGFK